MVDKNFKLQLEGFSLVTAEIFYQLPDYPLLLQSYLWQDYDLFPKMPKFYKFLNFWETNLDGKLHSIVIAHNKLISAKEIKIVDSEYRLN